MTNSNIKVDSVNHGGEILIIPMAGLSHYDVTDVLHTTSLHGQVLFKYYLQLVGKKVFLHDDQAIAEQLSWSPLTVTRTRRKLMREGWLDAKCLTVGLDEKHYFYALGRNAECRIELTQYIKYLIKEISDSIKPKTVDQKTVNYREFYNLGSGSSTLDAAGMRDSRRRVLFPRPAITPVTGYIPPSGGCKLEMLPQHVQTIY